MITPKTIEEYEAWIAKVGYVHALAQLAHIVDTAIAGEKPAAILPNPNPGTYSERDFVEHQSREMSGLTLPGPVSLPDPDPAACPRLHLSQE